MTQSRLCFQSHAEPKTQWPFSGCFDFRVCGAWWVYCGEGASYVLLQDRFGFGYAGVGDCRKALCLFREMRVSNVGFDRVSLISLISAAGNGRELGMGKVVHGFMTASGAEITVAIGTALIDMYSKCGSTKCARKVLNELQDESIVLWNSMIHGYVECGHNQEALELFNQIQSRKLRPDEVTMVGLILACRNTEDLSRGISIHSYIENDIHLQGSIVLQNAIIDMYVKCGSMSLAKVVFDKMPSRDVVSWTSIIVGHAINGEGREAILAFRKMCAEKVEPNSVTFIGVLSACDHAGLVEEGLNLYDDMCRLYHIKPRIEHCGCIIDMLARAGRLEEAPGADLRWTVGGLKTTLQLWVRKN